MRFSGQGALHKKYLHENMLFNFFLLFFFSASLPPSTSTFQPLLCISLLALLLLPLSLSCDSKNTFAAVAESFRGTVATDLENAVSRRPKCIYFNVYSVFYCLAQKWKALILRPCKTQLLWVGGGKKAARGISIISIFKHNSVGIISFPVSSLSWLKTVTRSGATKSRDTWDNANTWNLILRDSMLSVFFFFFKRFGWFLYFPFDGLKVSFKHCWVLKDAADWHTRKQACFHTFMSTVNLEIRANTELHICKHDNNGLCVSAVKPAAVMCKVVFFFFSFLKSLIPTGFIFISEQKHQYLSAKSSLPRAEAQASKLHVKRQGE